MLNGSVQYSLLDFDLELKSWETLFCTYKTFLSPFPLCLVYVRVLIQIIL